jgi:plasmid maintenance system antidote protein VapI
MKYYEYDIAEIRNTGSRVRALMDPGKDTVSSLARIANVSRGQMSKLLDDKCEWSAEKAVAMSKYFGVPFEYIFFGADNDFDIKESGFVSQFKCTLNSIDSLPIEEKRMCYKEIINNLFKLISGCLE